MLAREIVNLLPNQISSAVLFRLHALRPLADDTLIRRMFGLPQDTELTGTTHVVLTPLGPLLRGSSDGILRLAQSGTVLPTTAEESSLASRFGNQIDLLPASEPDCLGVGQLSGGQPVALHVRIDGLIADAVATFDARPPRASMELLRAVGVEYLGGVDAAGGHIAYFRNRLDQHLMAGALAGFARTDHCNLFFMSQGVLDDRLEQGLLCAAAQRIARGRDQVNSAVVRLARLALGQRLALTCVPPPPAPPAPYGDLVPLGFLLAALSQRRQAQGHSDADDVVKAIRDHLSTSKQDRLWSYHTGGLPTATDTSLVAQALDDPDIMAALERFRTDDGAYVAQLSAARTIPGHMLVTEDNRHWCEPDFASTCLVVARRRAFGAPSGPTWRWLEGRFDQRGGLFFANPFLTDWALAQAVSPEGPPLPVDEERLRRGMADRLGEELLAAQHNDGAFGAYDQALSTALAVLSLDRLRLRGRPMLRAQLRLLDWIDPESQLPPSTLFFSSLRVPARPLTIPRQHVEVGGQLHAVTFYHDSHRLITTALAAQALAIPNATSEDHGRAEADNVRSHPRYQASDALHYVGAWPLLSGSHKTVPDKEV